MLHCDSYLPFACSSRPSLRLVRARSRHNRWVNSFSHPQTQAQSAPSSEDIALQGLIARMSQGDSLAFETLYDATIQRVYSLVRRFARDDAGAQDVTQEVYLQAWSQASRFDAAKGAAIAWLLNVARSRALDAWRKAASSPVMISSDVAEAAASDQADTLQPIDFLEAADNQALLHATLQSLPPATRQMLSLAFFHDMSHSEISTHLRLPLGTVKSAVRRALISLREHLQRSGLPAAQLAGLTTEDTP